MQTMADMPAAGKAINYGLQTIYYLVQVIGKSGWVVQNWGALSLSTAYGSQQS